MSERTERLDAELARRRFEAVLAELRAIAPHGTATLPAHVARQLALEVDRLRAWVADLQSGMHVNCVYCGHRYGPNGQVPASMAEVLKAHAERCPAHPMSALRAELEACRRRCEGLAERVAAQSELLSRRAER